MKMEMLLDIHEDGEILETKSLNIKNPSLMDVIDSNENNLEKEEE